MPPTDKPSNSGNQPKSENIGADQAADLQAAGARMLEAISELGGEVVAFVAQRIKDDLQTQHDLLNTRNTADFMHIQAQFMQRAINQYTIETGKMVALNTAMINRILHPAKD